MKNEFDVEALVTKLSLGRGHEHQERAVAHALRCLLVEGRKGVVLADEVGFGKTYEALAVAALLCHHYSEIGNPLEKVLVLCKSSLVGKWSEEVTDADGFRQYLESDFWRGHPSASKLFDPKNVHVLRGQSCADEVRETDGVRGQRRDGKIQVPPGLYIVNHALLREKTRDTRIMLSQIWRTRWDLIIVDEVHHYAHSIQPTRIFAPDGDLTNYQQGISQGDFRHILGLTATPFELNPSEMLDLLRIIRADEADLKRIKGSLTSYVRYLERLFSCRQLPPEHERRRRYVSALETLRGRDTTGSDELRVGLEGLLRQYLIRNTKEDSERKYYLVSKVEAGSFQAETFDRMQDLGNMLGSKSLIPFEGVDALYYLELRDLIQETFQRNATDKIQRTFICMDLQQGLSSYPQIKSSQLLSRRDLASARRLRAMVEEWTNPDNEHLHPKVVALKQVVEDIVKGEIDKVRQNPELWFSKILIFSKMVSGTAEHLRTHLKKRVTELLAIFLQKLIHERGLPTAALISEMLKSAMKKELMELKGRLREGPVSSVPDCLRTGRFGKFVGRSFVDIYAGSWLKRCNQILFLVRAIIHGKVVDEQTSHLWLRRELKAFEDQLKEYCEDLASDAGETPDEDKRFEKAEQKLLVLAEKYRWVGLVGRYDGKDARLREARRRNFNDFYNPMILIVSSVGEEGLDLQKQCRYIIHYDIEWNPARMEQREGRVDRLGWLDRDGSGKRDNSNYIDIRFLLLKGTYEERIFHTVMLRNNWFQVLIGSKRKQIGGPKTVDGSNAFPGEGGEDATIDNESGRLTEDEKQRVMLDLRPTLGMQ